MKKFLYLAVAFLGTVGLFAQDLMIVNNTSAPMNGSIRLHNKFDDPHPELGDIDMAIPPAGNIWIFDFPQNPNAIPFSAINNPAMPFYTPVFGVSGGGSVDTDELVDCCTEKFKWSCIKTDIIGYFWNDIDQSQFVPGYIQIAPPYDPAMGAANGTSWPSYVALTAAPHEVFYKQGAGFEYDYNKPYFDDLLSPNPQVVVEVINGTSPFGGYVVTVMEY